MRWHILGLSHISPGLCQPASLAFCFSASLGTPSGSMKSIGRADTVLNSARSESLHGRYTTPFIFELTLNNWDSSFMCHATHVNKLTLISWVLYRITCLRLVIVPVFLLPLLFHPLPLPLLLQGMRFPVNCMSRILVLYQDQHLRS